MASFEMNAYRESGEITTPCVTGCDSSIRSSCPVSRSITATACSPLSVTTSNRPLDDLSLTCPELRQRLAEVGKTMTERLGRLEDIDSVTLHNDLHWKQILVDGERFTFLDLERMATGDPLIDVANLAAQMRMLGHRGEISVDVATAQAWAGEFLTQWERRIGKPINATRFRCYVVCSLFCLARGMMRHLRPGWRTLAQTCLELAESQLSSTGREAMAT